MLWAGGLGWHYIQGISRALLPAAHGRRLSRASGHQVLFIEAAGILITNHGLGPDQRFHLLHPVASPSSTAGSRQLPGMARHICAPGLQSQQGQREARISRCRRPASPPSRQQVWQYRSLSDPTLALSRYRAVAQVLPLPHPLRRSLDATGRIFQSAPYTQYHRRLPGRRVPSAARTILPEADHPWIHLAVAVRQEPPRQDYRALRPAQKLIKYRRPLSLHHTAL